MNGDRAGERTPGVPGAPSERDTVGLVLGTEQEAATPLSFWVYVAPDRYLQLDDVVHVRSALPDGTAIDLYGVVEEVRAVQEGVRFASDVALVEQGTLPAQTAVAARVAVTRVDPEIYVPPQPGTTARRAQGLPRETALFFDTMRQRFPIGRTRAGEPLYGMLAALRYGHPRR